MPENADLRFRSSITRPAFSPADCYRSQLADAHSLLLIRLRSLGDSILTLPLLEALHAWRPDLQLDVIVESPFAPVFLQHPAVHETLVLRVAAADGGWNRLRMLAEVRRKHYPAVLNLHGGTTSQTLVLASGAKLRIGQEKFRKAWIYNAKIPQSSSVWGRTDLHTVEHQLTLLRWLGIPVFEGHGLTLYLEEDARRRLQRRLERAGMALHGYLLIQPTATLRTKQWSTSNFARLADALARRHHLPVVFSSAPSESSVLAEIACSAQESHSYWSDLGLDELLALIDGCRLFIGNDSGPTHAAAALRKPIVVVWGSSDFRAWYPWETRHELIRSDLPCMPCPGYVCAAFGAPKCILDISVERVEQACDKILSEP